MIPYTVTEYLSMCLSDELPGAAISVQILRPADEAPSVCVHATYQQGCVTVVCEERICLDRNTDSAYVRLVARFIAEQIRLRRYMVPVIHDDPQFLEVFVSRFVERDGRHFEIAYTPEQIDQLVARYGFFAPWMPVCVVDVVEVKPVDHVELTVEISDRKGLDGPVDPT